MMSVDPAVDKVWNWIRSHLELGAVSSILVGVSTYVGSLFYQSYFAFYLLDGAQIKIPLENSIRTFVIVLVASALIVSLIATVDLQRTVSRRTALLDNIPLFLVILPIGVWAVGYYWSNVMDLSSWLARSVTNPRLRQINAVETTRVTGFLRWAVLIAPAVLGMITVATLSMLRISFSVYVMRQALHARLIFLALFVLIALTTASLCGKAYANLEYSGVFARPEVKIRLDGDKDFEPARSLYMLFDSDEVYYVASRPDVKDLAVHAWLIPRAAVKSMEFRESPANTVPLRNLILGPPTGSLHIKRLEGLLGAMQQNPQVFARETQLGAHLILVALIQQDRFQHAAIALGQVAQNLPHRSLGFIDLYEP
jgi:hypothetical protein